MKRLKQVFAVLIMTVALSLEGGHLHAQNSSDNGYREAYKTYKQAKSMAQNHEYDDAIKTYKKAISQAKGGGKNNAKLKKLAQSQIPKLYIKEASEHYQDFKSSKSLDDLDKAVSSFKQAEKTGESYGQKSVAQHAKGNITKLMYVKSIAQYSNKKYQDALKTINQTIDRNGNFAKAYYQKGLIYKKMDGHTNDALSSFDKAISVAKKNNQNSIVNKAKKSASSQLVYEGSQQLKNKNPKKAISLLKKSLKYDSKSADAYYRLAAASNKVGKNSDAITYAKKGLSYSGGGSATKAKFYYEEGKAYQAQGKKSQACKTLTKALHGNFKDSAHHMMKYELKCKQ
jgi:tetratricopeptide (TPR) repeat protein